MDYFPTPNRDPGAAGNSGFWFQIRTRQKPIVVVVAFHHATRRIRKRFALRRS
jgi:hypothetical protein